VALLRTYRVFISHAWDYSAEYFRVVQFLDEAPNFRWENLSVPEHDPLATHKLEYLLRNQMRPADVFIVIAGMYVNHSESIDFEMSFARRIGRPIIAVLPRGSMRVPVSIQRAAVEFVGWNGLSLVRAIRQHALRT
jgi:MTH538 TIR-like domain (DUF1863)